ncbi:MAG: class I SAM-dependent methyltransferase, partial [Pseudomonadota bacterium]
MLTARFKHLALKPGSRVLDLGCGEGRHVHGLHMLGGMDVIGVDLDEASLEKARAGLATLPPRREGDPHTTQFQSGDATRLEFADDAFDAVICSEVLEHLPDYDAALAEIRRVLKPDGRLCITVPHAWPERLCWRLA